MRRRRHSFGRYLMNAAAVDPAAADIAVAEAAAAKAQGVVDQIKQRRVAMGKEFDKQMKSSMEFMKQAMGGMLGFVAVNAIESVLEKIPLIADWGKLATKGIATGGVYLGATVLTQDSTVRRAVLIGSLINVGLSIVQESLSGKVNLGPGLSGNVIPYSSNDSGSGAYSGYDYGSGFDMPYSYVP